MRQKIVKNNRMSNKILRKILSVFLIVPMLSIGFGNIIPSPSEAAGTISDGLYFIRNRYNGKCLDIVGSGLAFFLRKGPIPSALTRSA